MMLLIPWSVWQFLKSIQHTFSCCDVGLIKFHRPRLPQGGHLTRSRVLWIWRDSSREMNQESKYVHGRKWSFSLRMQGSEELIGEVRRWRKGEATPYKAAMPFPVQTAPLHTGTDNPLPPPHTLPHSWTEVSVSFARTAGRSQEGLSRDGAKGRTQPAVDPEHQAKEISLHLKASICRLCSTENLYQSHFLFQMHSKKYICRKNVKCI